MGKILVIQLKAVSLPLTFFSGVLQSTAKLH